MAETARRLATWDDLARTPCDGRVYEVLDGELGATPRPLLEHGRVHALLSGDIVGPYASIASRAVDGLSLANVAIGVIHSSYGSRRHRSMPTRNISLTPDQDAFVARAVKAGVYQNASEAIRDALRVLRQRRREDALKLKALRMQIKAGVEAFGRGDFTEVAERDLEAYLEGLGAAPGKAAAR